jgi:hypothetical protein
MGRRCSRWPRILMMLISVALCSCGGVFVWHPSVTPMTRLCPVIGSTARALNGVSWAAVVHESHLVDQLRDINRVHGRYDARRFDELVHHIVLLKEGTVEVVATGVRLVRVSGSTARAALEVLLP